MVLVSPYHPWRGGIAQHGALLADALHREGHEVRLIGYRRLYPRWLYPGDDPRDPSAAGVEADGEIPRRALLSPLRPLSWWRAVRAIAAARPDVVLIQWWVPWFAPALAAIASGVRTHGARPLFVCHNVLPHDGGGLPDRWLVRSALGRGEGWLVHAASDETLLRALLGSGRTEGRVRRVPLPAFELGPSARGEVSVARWAARDRLGLPREAPLALFFGFVRPYKGLDELVEALPEVVGALPRMRCLVAGEFWEPAERFRRRAEALGVAAALRIDEGFVANERVADYLAAADVVVLPYREATQSAVAPMALAAGRPVIASRVGGLPDVVCHEQNGLLVPPRDSAALAAALRRFFEEPGLAARLGAQAIAGRPRLGWAPVVDALVELAERELPT